MEQLEIRVGSSQAIECEDPILKVKSDIEMTQEVKTDNAINAVLLGEGIDKHIEVIDFGVSQAERVKGYFGDKVALRGIAKRDILGYLRKAITNLGCCCFRDDSVGGATINGHNKYMSALEFKDTFKQQNRSIGIEGNPAHKTTAMPFFGFGPV